MAETPQTNQGRETAGSNDAASTASAADLFDGEHPPHDASELGGEGTPAPPRATPERDAQGRFIRPTPANEHPNYLVKQARSLGVPPETILSFTSEQLGDLVSDIQNRLLQERAYMSQAQAHANAQPPEPEVPTLDPFKEQLIPEMASYLEHRDKELAAIKKELKDAINEQKAATQRLLQAEQSRQHQAFYDKCDSYLAKHRKVVGEGRCAELQPGSPAYARCDAAITSAAKLPGGLTQENVDKAVAALFGPPSPPAEPIGDVQAPAGGILEQRNQDWAQAGLRRPTNRNGAREPKEDPKARAIRGVSQVLAGIDRANQEANGSIGEDDFLE